MKSKIVSASYIVENYQEKTRHRVYLTVRCEDESIQTLDSSLSTTSDYLENLLNIAGFSKEITPENLKELNGPVQNVLDVNSLFHVRFNNGKPSGLIKLN